MKDRDGQPHPTFNSRNRALREVDELIGLCKGIVADGSVNETEAEFLKRWLDSNRNARDIWPCNVLYPRIQAMLLDGTLEDHEERELLGLILGVSGGNSTALEAHSLASDLPLDNPLPAIAFDGQTFCFTGKFLCGSRSHCEEMVKCRGGAISDAIARDLSYLVVGVVGSRDWLHSTFGRKIEKAVELRSRGLPLKIVPEEHFVRAIA